MSPVAERLQTQLQGALAATGTALALAKTDDELLVIADMLRLCGTAVRYRLEHGAVDEDSYDSIVALMHRMIAMCAVNQ